MVKGELPTVSSSFPLLFHVKQSEKEEERGGEGGGDCCCFGSLLISEHLTYSLTD